MISGVNITDVLSQKTKLRPEVTEVVKDAIDIVKPSDFEPEVFKQPAPEEISTEEPEPEETEEESDYDASADALIDMLDLAQKSVFTLLGVKKLKKKIPDQVLERFQEIDLKDMMGQELTEEEQRQLQRYKAYEKRLERFSEDIPLTQDEREQLQRCTEKFCEKNKIVIPPGVWFGVQLVSVLSNRVINHIQL